MAKEEKMVKENDVFMVPAMEMLAVGDTEVISASGEDWKKDTELDEI